MNANELADKLADTYNKMENFDQDVIDAVAMLRQQQAEIEALKAKTLTDEEIKQVWQENLVVMGNDLDFARAILRKAQEK